MDSKINLRSDRNADIDEFVERFDEIVSYANKLTASLIVEIREKIDKGLLAFLWGDYPTICGNDTDNFEILYEWEIKTNSMKKTKRMDFRLYIRPHGRSNIPRYLYLQGKDQRTGKVKTTRTKDFSVNGIKRLGKNLKELFENF